MNEDKDLKCPKKGENMAFPVQALFRFIIYLFIYQLPKGSTLGSRDLVSPFFFYYNDSFCTSLTTSKDLYFFFFCHCLQHIGGMMPKKHITRRHIRQ